ncbi:hypothetical protein AV540_21475 [Brevibacillus parabrevis]|nr:hypothetical protein AV540_21475 [Brevibacillus parabrevis]
MQAEREANCSKKSFMERLLTPAGWFAMIHIKLLDTIRSDDGNKYPTNRITREKAPWLRVLSYHDLVNDIPEDRSERARSNPLPSVTGRRAPALTA